MTYPLPPPATTRRSLRHIQLLTPSSDLIFGNEFRETSFTSDVLELELFSAAELIESASTLSCKHAGPIRGAAGPRWLPTALKYFGENCSKSH